MNFLPFVAEVETGAAFADFLKTTQKRLLDALDHQDFTYGRLIKKFRADDRPRIEAVFNLERINDELALPGFSTEIAEIERGYTTNPLFLKAREYEAGLEIRFDYQTDRFSEESVRQWVAIYRAILESLISDSHRTVDEVAASLSPALAEPLQRWNETSTPYPRDKTVPALFGEMAALRGSATALRFDDREMSYRELAALIDERLGQSEAFRNESRLEEPSPGPAENPRKGGLHLATRAPADPGALAETTVAIQPKGDLPPLFAVHGGDGGVLFYGQLASRLGEDRPFYAFEAPALTATSPIPNESVEETAAHYLAEMKKVQPSGPYFLCGYSFGGVVAYEMARQLNAEGEEVDFLGLVDTENPGASARKLSLGERLAVNWNKPTLAGNGVLGKVGKVGMRIGTGLAYRLYFEAEGAMAKALPEAKGAGWLRQVQLRMAHERAMSLYLPGNFEGKLTLFRAMVGGDKFDLGPDYGWIDLVDDLEIVDVPGNHISLFHEENIDAIAAAFRRCLEALQSFPA